MIMGERVTETCFFLSDRKTPLFGPRQWKNLSIYIYISGQIIIFHQLRFPWNKGISLTKPPFGVRSCEVAIIWPNVFAVLTPPRRWTCFRIEKNLCATNGSNLSVLTRDKITHQQTISRWWLNQPLWKICLSKTGSSSPIFEVKTTITYLSCYHPDIVDAQLQQCSGMHTYLGMQSRPSLRSASWGSTTQRALWKNNARIVQIIPLCSVPKRFFRVSFQIVNVFS